MQEQQPNSSSSALFKLLHQQAFTVYSHMLSSSEYQAIFKLSCVLEIINVETHYKVQCGIKNHVYIPAETQS